jgi:hypothetical protein
MATDTMAEFMGVRVDPLDEPVKGDLEKVSMVRCVSKLTATSPVGYSFDGRLNDSFKVLNILLDKGVAVRRIDQAGDGLRAGDFVAAAGSDAVLSSIALDLGVDFVPLKTAPKPASHELKRVRVGMYQRYNGGNMDEGWTRFLLEQFSFPYTALKDAEIKKGNLTDKYDVIILPDDSTTAITGERPPAAAGGRGGEGGGRPQEAVPPEYRSGIGSDGVEALRAFVQKGGTLVTLAGASAFAIDRFALPVRNVLASKPSREFFCPGSTLRASFDTSHPLAYGMPSEGLVTFLGNNPAFEIVPNDHNEDYQVIARYADRDILQSGWLVGEENLAKKAAMVSAKYGNGRVVLIGFRTQHRAQTHGTFKLLFNALVK